MKKIEISDLVSITDLGRKEILHLCNSAKEFHEDEKNGKRFSEKLKGKKAGLLFFEDSTRTKSSFETAIFEQGGSYNGFSGKEGTAINKGESIRDTIKMFEANHCDVLVMRHPNDGSVQWAADVAKIPLINGGDGKNEHPTQALLDLFTLYINNNFSLDGLNIGLGGDLKHGRTIRSLTLALSNFNDITIRWAAEDELGLPEDLIEILEKKSVKIIREKNVENITNNVFAYYMTRPQIERIKNFNETQIAGILKKYRIDVQKIVQSKAFLMHPLPVNSKIEEIETPVFFTPNFIAYEQAENGIFMRKAILYEILKNSDYTCFDGKLNESLKTGNNRLCREINKTNKQNLDVKLIKEGIVIDHLKIGATKYLVDILGLENGFYIACNSEKHEKSYFKTELQEITERQLKQISMLSPEATINIIKDYEVIKKFVYLLCQNDNCITRDVTESVPSKIYNKKRTIRCRYCKQPYEMHSRKISPEEKEKFVQGLPTSVEKI
jgi:aspartate carbamoyltransferase catalytic subunit